jgi:hypothetical protein
MSTNSVTPGASWGTWGVRLSRVLSGAAVGAILCGGYGGLVAAVHFACAGRWDRGPAFAVVALLLGAALGLIEGVAAASSSPRRTNR